MPSRATTPTWAGRSATGRLDAHQGHSDAWIFPRKVRSLPAGFAYRDLIVTMTVGVVLLSLLVQGITMAPLLRRPGLLAATEPGVGYDVARGRSKSRRPGSRRSRRWDAPSRRRLNSYGDCRSDMARGRTGQTARRVPVGSIDREAYHTLEDDVSPRIVRLERGGATIRPASLSSPTRRTRRRRPCRPIHSEVRPSSQELKPDARGG